MPRKHQSALIYTYYLDNIFQRDRNILKREIKRLKEVRSKISILLETTGGILFSLEGFQKMLFTIKTLRRVIYIPLEGFRCPSWGVIIPLEGFSYPSKGFIIPLEGFRYPSWGVIIPLERFSYPS